MKKVLQLISWLVFVVSCQGNLQLPQSGDVGLATKSSDDDFSVKIEQPVQYLSFTDMSAFTSIVGLENRFRACDIPESIARNMTTDALLKSVLHYPLNYLIAAYNDPQDAVKLVYDYSAVHRELASRSDAAEKMALTLSRSTINMDPLTKRCYTDYENLPLDDEIFLEYFIASGLVEGFTSPEVMATLASAVSDKLNERFADEATYSMYSIQPLMDIIEAQNISYASNDIPESNSLVTESRDSSRNSVFSLSQSSDTLITMYTNFRQLIYGYHRTELTRNEINDITNDYAERYPNARVIGIASRRYNCHSFAWHETSIHNEIWLNASHGGSLQLSKYWTNDLYVSTTQANAEKAYYSDGDHSAIVLSSGKYRSKWGRAPLMEHDWNDCPYVTSNMQYFDIRNTPVTIGINGQTQIPIETWCYYSIPYNNVFNGVTYTWRIVPAGVSTPNPYEFVLDNSANGGTYRLKCNEYGGFTIYVDGYYDGHHVAEGHVLVFCLP